MTCLSVIAAAALLLSPMQSLAQNLSEKAKGPGKAVQQQQVDSRLAKRLQFAKPEQKNTPFKAAKKQVVKKQGMKRAGSGILLDDGRIRDDTTPEEFFDHPKTDLARRFLQSFEYTRASKAKPQS